MGEGRPFRIAAILTLAASATMTSGCVTVNAPDKPIEINLNVHISQEVVYKLDKEMTNLIDQNPGIF
ncbi:YnbE family lipoprotein [Sphingomonadaceae bacterium LXI357]|uniref:YnbE family lipoprotein n=2 Tax=Stakelama marina TaxID=2826939 RepID=A0A8T4IGC2_9SPHN|nr:YnbE family lipoprotein [Stakelama marina]